MSIFRAPFLVIVFAICNNAFGQNPPSTASSATTLSGSGRMYVFEITEFHLKEAAASKLHSKEILKAFEEQKKNGSLDAIETIRLSALDGYESMMQNGRRTNVTYGTTVQPGGRGVSRAMQQVQIGTMVRIMASEQGEKISTKLSYEASRLDGEATEDTIPDVSTSSVNVTVLLEPGKPTLVSGSSADGSTYIVVSVESPVQAGHDTSNDRH